MATTMLPPILGNTEYELSETVPRVPAGRAPRSYMEPISRAYRQRGIAAFLLAGAVDALGRNLQRSGGAWAEYLRRAPDEEKAASQAAGLFCSIACRDLETAAEIARHSRYTLNPDAEYEDDFLYVAFLMRRFLLGADDDEARRWLERLEAFLDGEPSGRLEVCRALLARDPARFEDALQQRIAEHRAWLEEVRKRDALRDDEDATDGQLFLEGLALVVLAERAGIPVAEDHPLVPSMARRATAAGLGRDSWRQPDFS